MLTCQVLSAALVALLAVPGMPLVALAVLLFVVILVEAPFLSARAALLVDVLPDDRYVLASAVGQLTIQGSQVFGFAAGGALVLALGPHDALLLDATSFLVAAALVGFGVRARPAVGDAEQLGGTWRRMRIGAGVVFGDPLLRRLVLLAWLSTFWVVPEGLASPYVHGRPAAVGLVLAAQPVGNVAGGLALSRLVAPATRLRLMGPLAVLSCAPLVAFVLPLPLAAALALLVLSGLGTTYNLPANAAFMQALPAGRRGQAFGLVAAGIAAGQGLGIALAGAIAEITSPGLVISAAGGLGLLAALSLSRRFVPAPSPATGSGQVR